MRASDPDKWIALAMQFDRAMLYGWEYVHIAIDDHSRLSFTQIHPDEKAVSAVAHLRAGVAWYASLGVTIKRVLTDNGSCYKSHAFARACRELGL